MKIVQIILIMGFLGSLFGCKSEKSEKKTIEIDDKKIETVESENPLSADYQLEDLNKNQKDEFIKILARSEVLIKKYSTKEEDIFNAENLDFVLEKWKSDTSNDKESVDEIVELIGCAFGQDVVDKLDCEWKILTDEYGTDFTVIHKKYKINGFPFSSVLKAIEENRVGSLNDIKLLMKKNIIDAENSGDYDERK